MPHVGVERLGAGDAQKHPAKHKEPRGAAGDQIAEPVPGIDRDEDRGVSENAPDTEQRDHCKP